MTISSNWPWQSQRMQPDRILEGLATWADYFRHLLGDPEGRSTILQLLSYISTITPALNVKDFSERIRQAIPETEELAIERRGPESEELVCQPNRLPVALQRSS
ncbi:MAG: hypothetical protein QM784_27855 [Polyangiaceae bacterium]